jgi:hypothetical protein
MTSHHQSTFDYHYGKKEREKSLKLARLALWLCPVALNVSLVLLGYSVRDYVQESSLKTALEVFSPVGSVILSVAWWHQARQILRSDRSGSLEPPNWWHHWHVFIAVVLNVVGAIGSTFLVRLISTIAPGGHNLFRRRGLFHCIHASVY